MSAVEEYLESLPRSIFDRIYAQPATCMGVLRLLPPAAKHLVMRLLYIREPIAKGEIEEWFIEGKRSTFQEVMRKLQKLYIFAESGGWYTLNRVFQQNLHNALVGGGEHHSFGQPTDEPDRHNVDIAFLDRYASEAWEAVLHSLVGTPTSQRPRAVVSLLKHSKLMESTGNDANSMDDLQITSKGFQFLLQDVNVQVWAFLLHYLEMAPSELHMKKDEILNFLFQLASLELGQDYSIEVLTPTQQTMMGDLKHLGIVYQRKKSKRFYPTRLATSLTSGAKLSTGKGEEKGFLIVETNYRIYAYTDSPLEIAVLSLFVKMKGRFANMVIGLITRDSIRDALLRGIGADQIIQYLEVHAHPEMRKQTPVLPATVVDQIRLWELERNRIRAIPGFLYKEFSRIEEYNGYLKRTKDFDCLHWQSEGRRLMVVSAEGHEAMKAMRKDSQSL
ncbi:transcription factor Tfb2-domain-containing protein [Cladochytrium replicatum]|nr:transcription factor Tfb2-domain-containing protein [Cladochytrium replicatum]